MTRSRWVQLLAALLLVLCLGAAGLLNAASRTLYARHGLGLSGTQVQSLPPQIAVVTTALGSFRGLFVNILWYRAQKLQDEGQFFEANTLAQALTTLLPGAPRVWSFQAWNMAYNISVATYTPQERWDWVSKGIALIRDQGIPANPGAILLYRELSWIFFHKVGERLDDMHWFYKQQLAYEWQELLGTPPEETADESPLAAISRIAEAPGSLDELAPKHPKLVELLARLAEMHYQPDEAFVRAVGRVLMYRASIDVKILNIDPQQVGYDPRLADLMDDPAYHDALGALLAFCRKQALSSHYHMDASLMAELMTPQEKGGYGYGPLDWRLPASHALYWSELGVRQANKANQLTEIDHINTWRQTRFALQQLARFGRISFDPITRSYNQSPDIRFFDPYEKAYLRDVDRLSKLENQKGNEGVLESFYMGHENLLLEAVRTCYLLGDVAKANEYYLKAQRLYKDKPYSQRQGDMRYQVSVEDFVLADLRREAGNQSMAAMLEFINGMLLQAFMEDLTWGRVDVFERRLQLARNLHQDFQGRSVLNPIAAQGRMRLLPFNQLVEETFINLMVSNRIDLLLRGRMWNQAPLTLRLPAYDRVRGPIAAQIADTNVDIDHFLPPPQGLDQYRNLQAAREKQPSSPQSPAGPPPLIERK
ncbi:MAG: hypothetical protein IT443_13185 [Phycisphaeraceae bacterium]|nr:hypothetical protein [Phycisphaeraceae bacterium]